MPTPVCVDASLVVKLLLRERFSDAARALWDQWAREGMELVVPPLFFAEVSSVLRQNVFLGRVESNEGDELFEAFLDYRVVPTAPPELYPRAWELAKRYNQRRAYDAQYLAVADIVGCPLWTGDERLANVVNAPWVRYIGAEPE